MDHISEFAEYGSADLNITDSYDQDTLKLKKERDFYTDENRSLQKSGRKATNLSLPLEDSSDAGDQLAASFLIENNAVEFSNADIKISRDGLYINGEIACGDGEGPIHQSELSSICELGRGACGVVKKMQRLGTNECYAVKVFPVYDRDKREQLLKEVVTLAYNNSPSLIDFYGAYLKDGSIHVILEYMDLGGLDLMVHHWRDIQYDEVIIAAVAFQMLWGLAYLHFERRLHRDIKPQNALINCTGEVKLGDFGIVRELSDEADLAQTMVGTIRYMSPERLAGQPYGSPGDIWSFGIFMLEMATRSLPFMQAPTQIDLHDMFEGTSTEEMVSACDDMSEGFKDVVRSCLCFNPDGRATADAILHCDWFEKLGMTELDIAVDVLHDWLEEHGKCIRDTDDADVDEGGLDDIFYNNTENRGGNNRQLDDNTTISSPSKCTTFGRMIGGWHSNGEENVLEFDPELVTTWVSEACSSDISGSECDNDSFTSVSNSRDMKSSSEETALPTCETPLSWNGRLR
eukprot:528223_1